MILHSQGTNPAPTCSAMHGELTTHLITSKPNSHTNTTRLRATQRSSGGRSTTLRAAAAPAQANAEGPGRVRQFATQNPPRNAGARVGGGRTDAIILPAT